ncbi:hypothetical protein [Bowdeniella nasicola]|uniref:hypothetical protein n=1 Tax=Bowdeniella nasicola TaxID=208480 RepID=UPI0011614432|nr:hypothetical protein [Bowdeniella nasicola]
MSRIFPITRRILELFSVSLAIAALAIPQPTASGISHNSATFRPPPSPTGETPTDHPEPRRWYGEAPPQVDSLIEKLGELTDRHNDVFAGVALAFDRQTVNIYTAATDYDTRAPEVAKLIELNSRLVNIVPVEHSKTELLEIEQEATAMVGENNVLSSYIDVTQNRVVVGVSPDALTKARSTFREFLDDSPVVFDAVRSAQDSVGRYDDYPRYFMGGEIVAMGSSCSTGIPVTFDGVKGLLTAGHCPGSRYTTPQGKFVGNQYTTAYPGNAYKYGDWKILYGSTYAPNVFNGPANSSTASNYKITGITKRRVGQEVCSSGRTTGQICRYVIEAIDSYLTVEGVRSEKLTHIYHDGDRNGYSDCNGWRDGDSGGPLYATTTTAGSVTAQGIVKGEYRNYLGRCRYSYTQFDGVTAWRSNVRLDR